MSNQTSTLAADRLLCAELQADVAAILAAQRQVNGPGVSGGE